MRAVKNKIVPTIVYEEHSENDSISTFHSTSDFEHVSDFDMIEYGDCERKYNTERNSRLLLSSSIEMFNTENRLEIKDTEPRLKRKSSLRKGSITSNGDVTPTKGRRLSFSDENGLDLFQTVYVENCHYPKKKLTFLQDDDESLSSSLSSETLDSVDNIEEKNSATSASSSTQSNTKENRLFSFVRLLRVFKGILGIFRKR